MKFEALTFDHMAYVLRNLRNDDRRELQAVHGDIAEDDLADQLTRGSQHSAVCLLRGRPVCAMGLVPVGATNTAALWLLSTPEVTKVGIGLTRELRRDIPKALVKLGYSRAQAVSMCDNKQANRWMKLLGATTESKLKKFGRNGEDFFMQRWLV